MSKPIHYQGTEYAGVESMPPDVRAAYEAMSPDERAAYEARYQADTAELDQMLAEAGISPDGETVAPAWGGSRPDGSVPVPVEFDQVTGLGPAAEVYAHDGIKILPNFGTPRANVMVRYRDGLAYRTGGKDVHTWRWDEVAVIQSNLTRHLTTHGSGYTEHEYTLTKPSGEKLILDDGLKGVGGAAETIKAAVFARIGPPLAQRYQAGEALTLGTVTIQRQNGLRLDGKPYAWDTIQDIKVESGRFKVTMRDGKKHEARVSAIPNVELLCQMIGVHLVSPELPYY
jgi:hypothetical protein